MQHFRVIGSYLIWEKDELEGNGQEGSALFEGARRLFSPCHWKLAELLACFAEQCKFMAILAGRLNLVVQAWVCVHARATPVRYETVVFALEVDVRGHEEAKEVTVRQCLPVQTQVLRD